MIEPITIDFETRSYADLKKVGAWAYSEDLSTDVICLAWGQGTDPIQTWWPGKHGHNMIPKELEHHLAQGGMFEAHNTAFEKAVWMNVLRRRYDWPAPPGPEQWTDTMAVAAYYALPLQLDRLASALGFQGKDPEGGRLISRYSKLHLKTAKSEIPPEDFEKFVSYCVKDVQIEQSVSDYLGDLPEREWDMWLLDQKMNARGLLLDVAGIAAAADVVATRADDLANEYIQITGVNHTQREASMAWFEAQGFPLDNMQAEYLEELLEEEGRIPAGPIRRALQIRLAINKASTKKLDAMARQVSRDGRARYQTRYHGTMTGRNSGTGFQPLNMNRGFDKMDPDQLVADIMHGDPEWLDMLYGDAMDAVAKASRYWIKAAPGHKIIAGDFVSIEAVVLACVAGEQWKIDAFRSGAKIYELMADKIYGLPPGTVTKETHPMERQDGKTGELAFGYQGALNAWLKFDSSGRHTDERIIEICKAWRAEHPMTVALWRGLESAAIQAVQFASAGLGRSFVGATGVKVGFEVVDDWLSMILPNGKRIWYFKPELRMGMPRWHEPEYTDKGDPANACARGDCDHVPVPKLTYMAQKTGQWSRVYTYGGKLTENAIQAISREVLKEAALRVENAGYPVILTVYDEIVTEPRLDFGSAHELECIMSELPQWAENWPIRAEAWEGQRYRK